LTNVEDTPPTYVGINIASGVAYFGAVRRGEALVEDSADRIRPNAQLDDSPRYENFRARVAQELRRLQPAVVGVARTRKYGQWTMAAATKRFGLEAAVMIAAAQEGIDCRLVTQEEAAKTVKVPIPRLTDLLPERLGIEPTPPYWDDRAVAFLVGAHLAVDAD
jgi:hypothetical protein